MRVLLLVGRSTGGIGTHVAQLAGDLRSAGDDVRVVAHPMTAGRFALGPCLVWWPSLTALPRVPHDATAALRVRRLALGSDVVHAHGHQAGLVASLLLLGRRRSRRPVLVVSWHNAVLSRKRRLAPTSLVQRWVVARADVVTGASTDLVDQARELGAAAAELAPVPSPLVPALLERQLDRPARDALRSRLLGELGAGDAEPAAEQIAARDTAIVLTVSRIAPQKNLPLLVRAAAETARPPRSAADPVAPVARSGRAIWVVVGDGDPELLAELGELARTTGAPVRFAGARGDVADWLAAADVFVLPSAWEARALVVQEAMAAGVPVVASDVGGLPGLLDGAGLLVTLDGPDAVPALAAAVRTLLDDPSRRAELGRRGRAVAAELPDGPATARRWHARYVAAAGRRGS
jgi:glycosyltransferase involved in cell wall biosynthesis